MIGYTVWMSICLFLRPQRAHARGLVALASKLGHVDVRRAGRTHTHARRSERNGLGLGLGTILTNIEGKGALTFAMVG